jgi:hypothetical protein
MGKGARDGKGLAAARVAAFLEEYMPDSEGPAALDDDETQWLLRWCGEPAVPLIPLTDMNHIPDPEPPSQARR